jgi:hypothetical protein
MNNTYTKIEEPSKEELDFNRYLMKAIGDYISKKKTYRNVLLYAISQVCLITFCEETPLSVKEQCEEIDSFCNFLKGYALRDATVN